MVMCIGKRVDALLSPDKFDNVLLAVGVIILSNKVDKYAQLPIESYLKFSNIMFQIDISTFSYFFDLALVELHLKKAEWKSSYSSSAYRLLLLGAGQWGNVWQCRYPAHMKSILHWFPTHSR